MSKAPVIGITVSIDHGYKIRAGHDYLYVKRAYAEMIGKAGAHPILISPDIDPLAAARICDGVVISGGDDLPPELYGEQATAKLNIESRQRFDWEQRLLDALVESGKPVLGVCYGMQLINVHFGGSLHQDILAAYESALDHGRMGCVTQHEIIIAEESSLYALLGPSAKVCSTHHQAVKRVADDFRVAATSTDGVIEAIERGNVLGVEWHPEADQTGSLIYSHLVERAKQRNR